MGNLWSDEDAVEILGDVPEENLQTCRRTLFGNFFNKTNINFTGFMGTMQKAWRNETFTCAVIEPGYFQFSFQ